MQEFRPADVIDRDTRLAASLAEGDFAALDELVRRYARAVRAVVGEQAAGTDGLIEVFTDVWAGRRDIEPGTDFAPWVGGLAARVAGRTSDEVGSTWATAMAVDAITDEARAGLRAVHLDGGDLADGADLHELRLRRRLAHLGDDAAVATALRASAPWSDPPVDLSERVRVAVTADDAPPAPAPAPVGREGRPDDQAAADVIEVRPGRVSRSLRPVLLGLAGAAAVLLVAIIALSAASGSVDPVAFTADLTPTGAILDVEGGEVTVTERNSGLEIELDAPTLPRRSGDQYYEAVLLLRDGTEVSAGTFNEGDSVTLTAGVDLARVEAFNVVARSIGSDAPEVVLKLDVPPA